MNKYKKFDVEEEDYVVGFLVRMFPIEGKEKKGLQLLPLTYYGREDDGIQDNEIELDDEIIGVIPISVNSKVKD